MDSLCLKWHMRLSSKKTKSMMINRSGTYAFGCGVVTFGGAELEITVDSKLTFDTHVHEVVSKATRSLGVVRRAGKFFDCPRVLKSYFNSCVLSSLEYCAPV